MSGIIPNMIVLDGKTIRLPVRKKVGDTHAQRAGRIAAFALSRRYKKHRFLRHPLRPIMAHLPDQLPRTAFVQADRGRGGDVADPSKWRLLMASTATYQITYVLRGGQIYRSVARGAPADSTVLERGNRRNPKPLFAIRYWPSKRGWRIMDIRNAMNVSQFSGPGGYSKWVGYTWSERVFPSEDSAVMVAITRSAA